MQSLAKHFISLQTPAVEKGDSTETFNVHRIEERPDVLLARDLSDNPTVLFTLSQDRTLGPKLRFNLDHISVEHDVACTIYESHNTAEATYTIMRCQNASQELKFYFLKLVGTLVDSLPPFPTYRALELAISHLIELFASLTKTPLKHIRGLWAELLVIAESSNPALFLSAWRSHATNRHDFGHSDERIEVKSATGRVRFHSFGLEQVDAVGNDRILVVSTFVEEFEGGTSVANLTEEITRLVSSKKHLIWKLESNVGEILGHGWREASTRFFDRALAIQSTRYFWSSQIPKPSLPDDGRVHSVKFVSDLTRVPELGREALRSDTGGLFANLAK